jgi:hypothetical protein
MSIFNRAWNIFDAYVIHGPTTLGENTPVWMAEKNLKTAFGRLSPIAKIQAYNFIHHAPEPTESSYSTRAKGLAGFALRGALMNPSDPTWVQFEAAATNIAGILLLKDYFLRSTRGETWVLDQRIKLGRKPYGLNYGHW